MASEQEGEDQMCFENSLSDDSVDNSMGKKGDQEAVARSHHTGDVGDLRGKQPETFSNEEVSTPRPYSLLSFQRPVWTPKSYC